MRKYIFLIIFLSTNLLTYGQWNTERILTIGRNALYFEDYVLSIQYFNQVIKVKPYLAEPYMYRAMAKIQLGDDKGAELDATEAINRNPFLPEAYYIRGFALRRQKNYENALSDFSKAYDFSPNNLNLLLNRMDTYMRLENYSDAMTDLNNYLRQSPKNKSLLYEKGVLHLLMKDTTNAEKSFVEFAQVDSTNAQAWSALALLQMQRNDKVGAYKNYTKAIKLKTTNAGDYMNRGVLNVQRKNYKEALKDYDKALTMDKTSVLAYYNRALLRANLGDNNNALSDLEKVIAMDSTQIEAVYRKALIENTLRMFRAAINDFNSIIVKHPNFIPAYWGIAEAYKGLGNDKEEFRYKQLAYNVEKNKPRKPKNEKEELVADNKMDTKSPSSVTAKKTALFNRFVTQDIDDSESDNSNYKDGLRGNVQNKFADVVNERNFLVSYYAKSDAIRRTNLYHPLIDSYNKLKHLGSNLKITNNEIPLSSQLVNVHFESINEISDKIALNDADADLYFSRALEYSLVQDFNSAIDDLNKALALRTDFTLAYFCRATVRYKLIDYLKNSTINDENFKLETNLDKAKRLQIDDKTKFEVEIVMRDLDKVMEQQPNFAFAYFNKANILSSQKDFNTAVTNYSKAIACDADFAEAYFNRGLTYLFMGNEPLGLADLSKAGELGIYQAYNLIQRFSN
ncbi:MAG: hypothetical protein AUK44_06255 [Porphyromonadaceae bacterium CG2_30_38_12]|nr:MAG: hypothetical protein AUK44_06255 [Porphyromonadaceae bacterium CG2_30_38_12]